MKVVLINFTLIYNSVDVGKKIRNNSFCFGAS